MCSASLKQPSRIAVESFRFRGSPGPIRPGTLKTCPTTSEFAVEFASLLATQHNPRPSFDGSLLA